MEKKVVKKKAISKAVETVSGDPFAEVAEPAAPKKRAAKTVKAKTAEPKATVKTVTQKAVASVSVDPFAEPVTATSPVKKRAGKKDSPPYEGGVAAASADGVVLSKKPKTTAKKASKKATLDVTAEIAAAEPVIEVSSSFKVLAEATLPALPRENRARLMMQTPTQLYFYWSIKENPYHLLRNVFGDETGSYTLVVKLTDLRRDTEEVHPVEAEGNWWFEVEPDGEYQAEIGFYAPNRPYFRVLYSNTVETPRRSPSPHAASGSVWNVSADKFAEVLDVAGFSQDAFDVMMAGDDLAAAENATHTAFSRFIGAGDHSLHRIPVEDIRYALLALASGSKLEDLRGRVSPTLFAILQANDDKLEAARAMSALNEYFDIDETEWTEEQHEPAVYGASLVNFPRTLRTTRGNGWVTSPVRRTG